MSVPGGGPWMSGAQGREWYGQWKAEWLHYGLIPAITPPSRSISRSFPHDGGTSLF
jgi:hypothetical protein